MTGGLSITGRAYVRDGRTGAGASRLSRRLHGEAGTLYGIVFDGLKADDIGGAGRAILPPRRQCE